MKSKKIIYIATVLASLIILSIVVIILFKDNYIQSDKDIETAKYDNSLIKAKESVLEIDDLSSKNTESHENEDTAQVYSIENASIEIKQEDNLEDTSIEIEPEDNLEANDLETLDTYDTITISAAGDVTLGRDEKFGWERTFDHELEVQNGNFAYFFNNVKHIFEADDLTIVNLETTLTTATKKAEKKYRFKANPSYVEILKEGNIEAVSIANNHTLDFLDKGYEDTLYTLDEAGVGYFGYEHKFITRVRDTKIGLLGYYTMKSTDKLKNEIKQAIESLKNEDVDIVVVMFHWGIERDYWPNSVQKELAYFSIDSGADLVLGSHPHVLQGIEEYKGKQIVYSLGNFCFGGNKNPSDKDTMIYVQKFNFINGELVSQEYDIIPCSISSVRERNNYQPTPLEGEEEERVLMKIINYSDF